jgi:hypothetical protein
VAGEYDAARITVREFDEFARRSPAVFFGVAQDDPRLATEVLRGVLAHALHPATRVAPVHTPQVEVEVRGDLAFSVTDDQADAADTLDGQAPRLGYFGSLLGPARWVAAVAAALSTRTVAEVWWDGRGFRQHLAGIRPTGEPEVFDAPAGTGTRVVFDLDPAYFGAGIAADLGSLDPHAPDCAAEPGARGRVVLRDLRADGEPVEHHYR